MIVKAALAPYMVWIKVGLAALLLSIAFVSGCNYGEVSSEKEIATLKGDKRLLQQANASWAQAAIERSLEVDANAKRSEQIQKQAANDAKDLERNRKTTEDTVADNQITLDKAVRDPKCGELLEMKVCATVPLP